MLILGNIVIVLIAVLVIGLAIVWLVFQNNPFIRAGSKSARGERRQTS